MIDRVQAQVQVQAQAQAQGGGASYGRFRPVTGESKPRPRLILALWGDPKEGKTHLALDFPAPLFLLNFDYGWEEIAAKFASKDIRVADYFIQEEFDPDGYRATLDRFSLDWRWALQEASLVGGTVVVDTATQVWQLVQAVKLEEVRQRRFKTQQTKSGSGRPESPEDVKLYPYDYAAANLLMGSMLRRAHQAPGVNVVWIHRSKQQYSENGQPTGRSEFQGFAETPAIAQATLKLSLKDGVVYATFDSSRANKDLKGLTVANPTYQLLRDMLLPGGDEED